MTERRCSPKRDCGRWDECVRPVADRSLARLPRDGVILDSFTPRLGSQGRERLRQQHSDQVNGSIWLRDESGVSRRYLESRREDHSKHNSSVGVASSASSGRKWQWRGRISTRVGPEPSTPADLKREADHKRLVRAFPMAGEAIDPKNAMRS
jgi:hypothetical protein